jgi:hypothetical protein
MAGIGDTAYPQLKTAPSAKELAEVYTPNFVELVWAEKRTREPAPRVGLLALLKTFQRLGYFVPLSDVPVCLLEHIARSAGYDSVPAELFHYDASSVRRRHMLLVRDYAAVKAWGEDAEAAMETASRDAARTLDDLPDIINVVLEQLVRQRFELPAFSTLLRAAQHARALANREYQSLVCDRLDAVARERLAILLTRVNDETKSPWHRLKGEPKQPTAQNNRDFLDHLAWLKEQAIIPAIFRGIPDVKLKQFAAEARSLDAASMNDLTEAKRLTLAATLVFTQTGRALDDVADMYVRLVLRLHNQARTALLEYQLYFAFRELGHAVRTGFLLDYLSDIELRRLIQTATNKSERFNQFLQWIAFGGGALAAEGIRDEQRKFIKYNHLVANLLIFHNVVTMSNALERLVAEGYELDANLIACSSPYLTEHLNRFGRYSFNRDRVPEPLDSVREFKMPPRGEKPLRTAQVAV